MGYVCAGCFVFREASDGGDRPAILQGQPDVLKGFPQGRSRISREQDAFVVVTGRWYFHNNQNTFFAISNHPEFRGSAMVISLTCLTSYP